MRDLDALRNSHGRLPAVMRSRSSILITLDQHGTVLLWNSGAEKCFGRSEEQVMGLPFKHAGIRWDWERITHVAPGGVSEHAKRIVLPYSRPDGSLGVVAMQILPQFGPDGELTGCLWLGSDTGQTSVKKSAASPAEWVRPVAEPVAEPVTEPTPPVQPTRSATPPAIASTRAAPPAIASTRSATPPAIASTRPAPPATASTRSAPPAAKEPPAANAPLSPSSASTRSFAPVPIGMLRTPPPDSSAGLQLTPPVSADPSKQFPVHLSFLDSHLVSQGDDLSNWRILHAKETRLDEEAMEVEFTLSRRYPGHGILTRRILISSGELVSVQES